MNTPPICPQCGKSLPSDSPQGLCPACLLKSALPGQSVLETAATILPDSSPTTDAGVGTRLKYFGDYELLEEIAQGGMGVVWKARQTSLNRVVALKMIRAGTLATQDEVERFLREAEAAANLQHPNIVAIHEVGEHGGQRYFTMDYVAGRDLGAMVKDGPLSSPVAARYVKIIAEAIQFAHQRGILHRDLKPQNVIIDAADQPRITDFGLAKIMKDDSHLTQTGVIMGSPSYMPPEQAGGRHGDIGPASDVYSLGAMLYELLTGKPPFRGSTALATMIEVMEAEPTAPRRLKADISPDLETVCLKCLEKSPTARYPTAKALAEELDRYLKGEPILAKPASAVRKTVSWARRHPMTLAAVAALVIVALIFGVFYLFEENAFLRAQKADSTLARVPPRNASSNPLWYFAFLALLANICLFFEMRRRSRGLFGFKHLFDKAAYTRPLQPLGERTRMFALGASLVLIGYFVTLLLMLIHAYVWEGKSIFIPLTWIFCSIYLGLATLGIVIQDYRLVHYGKSSESSQQLTAEQIEPIRRALEAYDLTSAIKHYRETVPEVGEAEAKRNAMRLFYSLRAQNPGQFAPPPLSLATLNWRSMLLVALIEAVVLGVLWFMMPPSHPASAVSQFSWGLLISMGAIACTRVKGVWKWLLLSVLALALMILSQTIVESAYSKGEGDLVPGVFFGFFVYSLLIRMGAIACTRVEVLWKWVMLFALALAVMILSHTIMELAYSLGLMSRLADDSERQTIVESAYLMGQVPYMCGIFCGFFLMASAFKLWR